MGKILVFGDSITYGKWDSQSGWVARLRQHIDKKYNLPHNNNFQVYNLGIPGEVAPRLAKRFEAELIYRIDPSDKNVVVLAIGVNDSCPNNWMTLGQTPSEDFKESLSHMILTAKKYQCQVACIGLAPVNEDLLPGLHFSNNQIQKYDKYIHEVCEQENVVKLNWFQELVDNNFAQHLVDGIHPDDAGHGLMTDKIITFLNQHKLIECCV